MAKVSTQFCVVLWSISPEPFHSFVWCCGVAGDFTGLFCQRPAPTGRRYNYLFYMDIVGCLTEEKVQNALRHLSESSAFLHVLGSYPQLGESSEV